jgi:glycerol dehydrogenase-like iron-containing ADH family enzyme
MHLKKKNYLLKKFCFSPTAIYIDVDLIRQAPRALNLSGVGDVFCFHTAHFDWQLATKAGKADKWPYQEQVAWQVGTSFKKVYNKKIIEIQL